MKYLVYFVAFSIFIYIIYRKLWPEGFFVIYYVAGITKQMTVYTHTLSGGCFENNASYFFSQKLRDTGL